MKAITIILGVLCIIGGIACIAMPGATYLNISWILGILFLVMGINGCIDYFRERGNQESTVWDLIGSIATVIFAVVIFSNVFARYLTDVIAIYLFAGWILASGIFRIAAAIKLKGLGGRNWIWMLVLGIVTVLLGIYSFFHPLITALAFGTMIGLMIIMQGVNLIALGVKVQKV